MKKYIDISIDCFPVKIIFCPTKKAHRKYLDKNHKWMSNNQKDFKSYGNTTYVDDEKGLSLIVGIDNNKDDSIYIVKEIIVHELSHCATEILKYCQMEDDETRSYILGNLYKKTMLYYDKYIDKVNERF